MDCVTKKEAVATAGLDFLSFGPLGRQVILESRKPCEPTCMSCTTFPTYGYVQWKNQSGDGLLFSLPHDIPMISPWYRLYMDDLYIDTVDGFKKSCTTLDVENPFK